MIKCHCAAINSSECICKKIMSEKKPKTEKITLIYDQELGAYRIPQPEPKFKFEILNAYVEIERND
jgi:hypothetical protein